MMFSKASLIPLLLAGFMLAACDETAKSTHGESKGIAQKADATPDKPVKEKPTNTPIETPKAYFGTFPLERVVTPIPVTPQKKSSVVLLVLDALNAKHLGIYGYRRPTSPNLDKLAKEGLLLSNYVSNSSWTRPSFTTIITGLTKKEHGVELNKTNVKMSVTTLAERFRLAGYRTAGIVGNPLVREVWGYGQGFQLYEDTHSLNKVFPPDKRLVDKATAWLKRVKDEPFFLMIFLTAPHTPYRPLKRHFLKQIKPGPVIQYPFREYKKPLKPIEHDRIVAAYDDEILYMDGQIGSLLETLEKLGVRENTTIMTVADHGEAFGDHNCYTHTYHMWESTLRVPAIVNSPAFGKTGIYDDRPFTHIDIAPTLLELAGIERPKDGLSGISIPKMLQDPSAGRKRILFSQYNAHGIQRQAIREEQWKLIHHHKVEKEALRRLNSLEANVPHADPKNLPSLATDGERYEFYNLVSDPEEKKDLFSSMKTSEQVTALRSALGSFLDTEEQPAELSEELLKALENAGYITRSPKKKSKKKKSSATKAKKDK